MEEEPAAPSPRAAEAAGAALFGLRDEVREMGRLCDESAGCLREWRLHFEALFSLQDLGYLCVDARTGAVTRMNAAARRMFGVEGGPEHPSRPSLVAPVDLASLVPKLNAGMLLGDLRRSSAPPSHSHSRLSLGIPSRGESFSKSGRSRRRRVLEYDVVCKRSDGQSFLAELRLCALDADSDASRQLCIQVRDVSWKAGRSANAVMDASNDAVIVMNEKSTITSFNRRAEEMFGWTAEEAIGEKVEILMSRLYASMHHRAIKQFLAGGKPKMVGRLRETQAVRRNGQSFPVELSVSQTRVGGELLFIGSVREISARRRALEELEETKGRFENLLLNVLPAPVAKELLEEQPAIALARRFEDVVVLFADIVGFTTISEGLDPRALVLALNEVFSKFDALCERFGLEKIKTIGDAYMACSGLPFPFPGHVEAAADMALEMIEVLETVPPIMVRTRKRPPGVPSSPSLDQPEEPAVPRTRVGSFTSDKSEAEVVLDGGGGGGDADEREIALQIRVGMHVGPVVAGVVGFKKLAYDVWSDTVNTASRMESSGVAGRVHATGAVEARLRHAFDFEPRGSVHVKGKGPMDTFILVGRRPPPRSRSRANSLAPEEAPPGVASLGDLASLAAADTDRERAGAAGKRRQLSMHAHGATAQAIRMQQEALARAEMGEGAGAASEFVWERVGEAAFNAREMVLLSLQEARLLAVKLLRMLGVASLTRGAEAAVASLVHELQSFEYASSARAFHHQLQAAHQFAVLVRGLARVRRHVYPPEVLGIFLALLCQNAEGAVDAALAAFRMTDEERRQREEEEAEEAAHMPPEAHTPGAGSRSHSPAPGGAASIVAQMAEEQHLAGGMAMARAWLSEHTVRGPRKRSDSGGGSGDEGAGSPSSRPATYRAPARTARPASLASPPGAPAAATKPPPRPGPAAGATPAERIAALLAEVVAAADEFDDRCAGALCACLEASREGAAELLSFAVAVDEAIGELDALRSGDVDGAWSLSDAARRRLCRLLFHFCSLVDVYKLPAAAERTAPAWCYAFFPELRREETAQWMQAQEEHARDVDSDGHSSVNSFFSSRTPASTAPLFGSLSAALVAPAPAPRPPVPKVPSGLAEREGGPLAPAWPPGAARRHATAARARQAARLPPHLLAAWRAAAEHCIAFLDIVVAPVLELAGRVLPELRDEAAKLEQPREMWRAIAWGGPAGPEAPSTPLSAPAGPRPSTPPAQASPAARGLLSFLI